MFTNIFIILLHVKNYYFYYYKLLKQTWAFHWIIRKPFFKVLIMHYSAYKKYIIFKFQTFLFLFNSIEIANNTFRFVKKVSKGFYFKCSSNFRFYRNINILLWYKTHHKISFYIKLLITNAECIYTVYIWFLKNFYKKPENWWSQS